MAKLSKYSAITFLLRAGNSYREVKRVSDRALAPVPSVKIKKRPRGKSFQPGHGYGSAHRFKPGQSGNPQGRPACKEISKALREILASDHRLPAKTGAEKVARKWFEQGLLGNVAALVSLADRVEGRPNISISHDGSGDNLTLILTAMNERHQMIGPPEHSISIEAADAD
jgi:uncharacterized protein DUF5681